MKSPRWIDEISDLTTLAGVVVENPFQTDRLNAIHMTTKNSMNVLGCMIAYTLIKTGPVLNLIDFIFRVGSLADLIG